MGDPRTEKEFCCQLPSEIQVNGPVKIVAVVDHFSPPKTPTATNEKPNVVFCNEIEANVCPEKLDVMTRSLNICREIPCMGIIFALMSALFFGIAALVVKFVPKVNPLVVVIFQCSMQVIVFLPIIVFNRFSLFGTRGERTALFSRGFFGFLSLTTSYIAYRWIPLSDAITICASAPVFVSIVACVILKEECGVFQAFTVVVTLSGVLLISRPTFIFGDESESGDSVEMRMEGTIIAVVSCISGAMIYIAIRKLQQTPSVVVIHTYSVCCIVFSLITASIIHFGLGESAGKIGEGIAIPETWSEIGWLVLNGLSGVLAQIALTVSLKIEEAGLVSLVRTSDIIIAFVFQLLFLGNEKIMWTSFLGAVIVFSGVFVSGLRRWLKSKPGKFDTLWLILNCGQRRPTVA